MQNHTKNMRAAIVTKFGGPEVLELAEIQIPTPNSHQVLIHVQAASVRSKGKAINPNCW